MHITDKVYKEFQFDLPFITLNHQNIQNLEWGSTLLMERSSREVSPKVNPTQGITPPPSNAYLKGRFFSLKKIPKLGARHHTAHNGGARLRIANHVII